MRPGCVVKAAGVLCEGEGSGWGSCSGGWGSEPCRAGVVEGGKRVGIWEEAAGHMGGRNLFCLLRQVSCHLRCPLSVLTNLRVVYTVTQ